MHIERHEIGPRFSEMSVVDVGTGKLVFIAGQVAENTALDIGGQTREVLGFIDRLLLHVGARREHIVSARVYLAYRVEIEATAAFTPGQGHDHAHAHDDNCEKPHASGDLR
jgi:hypothetical protein